MDIAYLLGQWVKLTRVNPKGGTIRLRDMDVQRANDILKESLQIDDTMVTTLMLLEPYLDDFVRDRTVSLKEIMEDEKNVFDWLNTIRDFRATLRGEEVTAIKNSFKDSLRQAFIHYGIDMDKVEHMLADDKLCELRYSAFRNRKKLEISQFSSGEPSSRHPRLYDTLYTFADVNTLLQWMLSVESGVVLCLIRNPEYPMQSYFVFAVRNGGNMYLVSDREKPSHPLHNEMSRSRAQGRSFYERIDDSYFPYDIMNIDYGDNNRAYVHESQALISKNDGAALQPIKDMQPYEIVWLVMMFSLLHEKFFKENYQAKQLTYTPQMMVESDMLLKASEEKGIVIRGYQPLIVAPLTFDDISTEAISGKGYFAHEPMGDNDWMIKRYPVPDDTFNVLPDAIYKPLLLTDGTSNQVVQIHRRTIDPAVYNDATTLEKDRIYLARYNLAKGVQQQLKLEHRERKDEVSAWYRSAIKKNLPRLLKAVVEGEFLVQDKKYAKIRNTYSTMHQENGNIMRRYQRKYAEYLGYMVYNFAGESTENFHPTCVVNNTKATILAHFYPTNASMLADMCGCQVEGLHELLQYYCKENEKRGEKHFNQISQRVDPMDWAVKNPWEEMKLDVVIYLSRSGYAQICKENDIPNDRFWIAEDEKAKKQKEGY